MKTSVVMIRKMGQFNIHQRTNDGMFNATSLANQWSLANKRKDVSEFLSLKGTKEFVETVKIKENLNTVNPVLSKRGKNGGTWLHPLVFIDFAMWLNPSFKYDVLKFVYDELIKQRNDAGDGYLKLSASGVKLKGYDFVEVAKAIQHIVYKETGKQLRQTATETQLIEINDIQTKLSFAIDFGYIKSYPQLLSELRKMYKIKYLQTPF
jgi:hypothetical protein